MSVVFRWFVCLWLAVSIVGCTSMQALSDTQPSTVRREIHPGDEVEVTNKQGQTYNLKVTQVDSGFLYGNTDKLAVKMPLKDIVRLDVSKVSAGRTAGAVGAGVVATYVLVIALGAALVVAIFKNAVK